jgi:hypothetical protein
MTHIDNITVRVVQRVSTEGHPCSDLFTEWDEDGCRRYGYSRCWWVIDDTPHSRAAQIAAFKKRMAA